MVKRIAFLAVVAALLLAGSAAVAQSASELLEQGIYTEETVGDLDKAIEIYKKVVAESKMAEAAAAEAQYRLGQCLLKQQKPAEAKAAFQKLIDEYPDQKDWVAKAREHVPAESGLELLPAPWKDGEFMQLTLKMGQIDLGSLIWSVEAAQRDGRDIWRMKTIRFVLEGGENRGLSIVDVDKATLQPLWSTFRHTLIGHTDADYKPGGATVTQYKDGKPSVREVTLDKVYYDNEEGTELFRCLPWAEGYKATVPIYASFGGGQIPIETEVVGKETVEVKAGKFDCFKVLLRPVNQFFWYSADANRYLVKLEVGGMTAELEQIGYNKPDQTRPYRDEELGFSLALPAGWYAFGFSLPSEPGEAGAKRVFLIDPEAAAMNFVRVEKTESVSGEAKKSARAWAEERIKKTSMVLKDFQVRPDTWKEQTVAGLPAVSVVGDYTEGPNKKTLYSVCVLGKETAAQLAIMGCRPDDLQRLAAEFDKIVESYQAK